MTVDKNSWYVVGFGASVLVAIGLYNLYRGMLLSGSVLTIVGLLYLGYIHHIERA